MGNTFLGAFQLVTWYKAQTNFQLLRTQVQNGKIEPYAAAQNAVSFLFE